MHRQTAISQGVKPAIPREGLSSITAGGDRQRHDLQATIRVVEAADTAVNEGGKANERFPVAPALRNTIVGAEHSVESHRGLKLDSKRIRRLV